jgi:hypothetical protein
VTLAVGKSLDSIPATLAAYHIIYNKISEVKPYDNLSDMKNDILLGVNSPVQVLTPWLLQYRSWIVENLNELE